MKSETLSTSKHILAGSLLGAALAMTPMTALAQSACRSGSCGSTAGNEDYRIVIAKDLIKSADPTVNSGSLMDAWLSIKSVDEQIEELDVRTLSEIRNGTGCLVNTLQERLDEAIESAQESYFEGYHTDALSDFDSIALPKASTSRSTPP